MYKNTYIFLSYESLTLFFPEATSLSITFTFPSSDKLLKEQRSSFTFSSQGQWLLLGLDPVQPLHTIHCLTHPPLKLHLCGTFLILYTPSSPSNPLQGHGFLGSTLNIGNLHTHFGLFPVCFSVTFSGKKVSQRFHFPLGHQLSPLWESLANLCFPALISCRSSRL